MLLFTQNDLKRFGLADMEEHYEDDLDSEWMPNSCGGDVGFGYPYSDFMNYDEDAVYDFSQIDPSLLREILHQMKYDPRFEHLLDHLNEGNSVFFFF